jgi:hypothetical protein
MKEIKREVRGGKKKDLAARHRCKYGNYFKNNGKNLQDRKLYMTPQ